MSGIDPNEIYKRLNETGQELLAAEATGDYAAILALIPRLQRDTELVKRLGA